MKLIPLFLCLGGLGILPFTGFGQTQWLSTDFPSVFAESIVSDGDILLAGSPHDLWRSTDQGTTWIKVANGLPEGSIFTNSLINVQELFFASVLEEGIFSSSDQGLTWQRASDGLASKRFSLLAAEGTQIFAVAESGAIYRSFGDIVQWQRIESGIPEDGILYISAFASLAGFVGHTYFAGSDQGLFKSDDDGRNWQHATTDLPDDNITALMGSANNMLFAGSDRLYRSEDFGSDYAEVTGVDNGDASIDFIHSDAAFILVQADHLHLSRNSGYEWQDIEGNLPAVLRNGAAIIDQKIFLATHGAGIWMTDLLTSDVETPGDRQIDLAIAPQPANEACSFRFYLPVANRIRLTLYSRLGQTVFSLTEKAAQAGPQHLSLPLSHLPAGSYVYRLQIGKRQHSGLLVRSAD